MSADSESYRIRPFRIEDYSMVVALWKASEGIGLSEADEPEPLRLYLERNPGMSLVAERESRIVGAVLCGHDGRRGYLHHLAILPECRGQGIGSNLVDQCINKLQAVGIQKCHIFVYPDNEAGLTFWSGRGFAARADIQLCSRNI
jgi:putative acetyltransferase